MERQTQTRRAIRLVRILGIISIFAFFALTQLVTRDSMITRAGRQEDVHYVHVRAQKYDRGKRPIVWLVGNSALREAFDTKQLRQALEVDGTNSRIEKFGIGRGGPIFAWALTRELDIRPGDRIVTLVAFDHFRRDWIRYHDGFAMHLQYLFGPRDLFRIESLPLADKLEYSLASVPPRAFWQHRESFHNGLRKWTDYYTGQRKTRPRVRKYAKKERLSTKLEFENYRTLEALESNLLADEEMVLEPGQVNYDALFWLLEDVREKGGEPFLVFLPHNPLYYERFISKKTEDRFHAHMGALGVPYLRLPPRPEEEYMDFHHPNYLGRPHYTDALAEALIHHKRN